jgi:anti-sigma regulatory factor (Ser/Thr protein kinase)
MVVDRKRNIVQISGRFDGTHLRSVLWNIHTIIKKLGFKDVILDFADTSLAFESGMLPLLAQLRRYRVENNVDFQLLPPRDVRLRALFSNAGWDNCIDPIRSPLRAKPFLTHVPVMHFKNQDERADAVDQVTHLISSLTSLSRDNLQAITWSLDEITDNVLQHAVSKVGGLMQASTFGDKRIVEFIVADAGIGIPKSLNIQDPKWALESAIREGVTKNKETNQGNGLYGVYRIALVSNGQFNLQSANGNLYIAEGSVRFRSETVPYTGTFVRWSIPLDATDLIARALVIRGRPHVIGNDFYERIFEDPKVGATINLSSEFRSFGSREIGRQAYQKIANVLNWEPGNIVHIDFFGVTIISSSFADEVFGRLFLDLGPLNFMGRIKFVNASGDILGLIDRAISQRIKVGQT